MIEYYISPDRLDLDPSPTVSYFHCGSVRLTGFANLQPLVDCLLSLPSAEKVQSILGNSTEIFKYLHEEFCCVQTHKPILWLKHS